MEKSKRIIQIGSNNIFTLKRSAGPIISGETYLIAAGLFSAI